MILFSSVYSIHFWQGAIATTMTQPLDVLKTRAMNAKPGEFKVNNELHKFILHNLIDNVDSISI